MASEDDVGKSKSIRTNSIDLDKYAIGKEAYLYKPPTMADTITRGRRAKHIDHYVGPGLITRHIGTRSMVITLNGREFQRDAGMIILEKPIMADYDPTVRNGEVMETQLNNHA
jgi:hypothetical protein